MTHNGTRLSALHAVARQVGCAALALSLAGCAPQGACKLTLATTIPISFASDRSAITIPVWLGTRQVRLMVDTGAQMTVLSGAVLTGKEFLSPAGSIAGIGGTRLVVSGRVAEVRIGGLSGTIRAYIVDIAPTRDPVPIVGLLGMDVLGNYDVDVDLWGRQLGLYLPQGDCSGTALVAMAGQLFTAPEPSSFTRREIHPAIRVSIGGTSVTALLDTGSGDTVMSRSAAHSLGLTDAVLATDPIVLARGIGPNVEKSRLHLIDKISIGDLELHNVPVEVLPSDLSTEEGMLIGRDLYNRAHVWISNSSHTVVLQVPPSATPALKIE